MSPEERAELLNVISLLGAGCPGAGMASLRKLAAPSLRDALQALLDRYVNLVNSGDAGNWDPEEDNEVKDARWALEATK